MAKHIRPERLILRDMVFQPGKEVFQRNSKVVTDPTGCAIRFKTAVLSTLACQATRLYAHVTELSAASIVAGV
ncbi:hypothetical protein SDC9_189593 [bioreactor metagenome]|uniref:Uncharacterized protein n=1 Tax=bioreactor metagenome TaxID=1076179 RepID=A0A645HSV8_9ZZZZ